MAENSTTTAVAKGANKAGQKIIDTVAAAGESVVPTVVETGVVNLAAEVPTKVVLNQRVVVAASIVGGAALGAGVLYGVQKLRTRKRIKDLQAGATEALSGENA